MKAHNFKLPLELFMLAIENREQRYLFKRDYLEAWFPKGHWKKVVGFRKEPLFGP